MDEETKLAYDANHVFREGYDAGYKDRGKELSCMIKEIHDNVYQEGLERGRKEALEELTKKRKLRCSQCNHFIKNLHKRAYGRCEIKNSECDKICFRPGSCTCCDSFEPRKE